MSINFGLIVPQGWRMDLPPHEDPLNQFESMQKVAIEAERLGFDSIWLQDHFHTAPVPTTFSCFECWTTLTALACKTQKIRLGQNVLCNSYRFPQVLAKMAATLDNISNGRLELGLGAGWYQDEYIAYGIPFPRNAVRVKQLEEAVQIIKAMWTEDRAKFKGRYYRVDGAICSPKPLQKPRPRIWIGGAGEKLTLKLVARHGDACNFIASPIEYAHKLEVLRIHCARVGRKFDEILKSLTATVIVGKDTDDVKQAFRRYLERERAIFDTRALKYGIQRVLHQPLLGVSRLVRRLLGSATPEEIVGSSQQCIEKLQEYVDLGVSYFIIYLPDAINLDCIRLFAEEVMTAFDS